MTEDEEKNDATAAGGVMALLLWRGRQAVSLPWAASGVVSQLPGGGSGKAPFALRAEVLTGAVLVQRKGVSYQLKDGESLQTGDQVTLKGHGSATLTGEGCKVRCGEGSAFLVGETEGETPS